MNDLIYNKLRETSWKRRLTADEEARLREWLAANPEARANWELEAELNSVLARLPDAPVPSNFTARVMQAVDRKTTGARPAVRRWSWRQLLPRTAVALVVLGVGWFGYERYQSAQRAEIAQNVSAVAAMANPVLLADFEAKRHVGLVAEPDEDLIALFETQ